MSNITNDLQTDTILPQCLYPRVLVTRKTLLRTLQISFKFVFITVSRCVQSTMRKSETNDPKAVSTLRHINSNGKIFRIAKHLNEQSMHSHALIT